MPLMAASGQERTFEALELSGGEAVRLERDVRRRPELTQKKASRRTL
ncbi:protein of unknown function [Stenotrophomonas maltophilia]|nr:protein of unknown function [Stenotrophomonas maltophilia]